MARDGMIYSLKIMTILLADDSFMAILEDGRVWRNITFYYDPTKRLNIRHYYDESDLPKIMKRLDKHLVRTPNIKLNNYIMGNNNNFVFACPKNLVYNEKNEFLAEFFFPDPHGEEIVAHCRDDKTTPIITNNKFNNDGTMVSLDKMDMVYMGDVVYTNDYGYTEQYMVWKSNGFFTRLFENYGIDIHIKIGDFNDVLVQFDNNTELANVINYDENNEIIPIDRINADDVERTENMVAPDNTTVNGAGTANTVPVSNAPSIRKVGAGKLSNVEEKPKDNNTTGVKTIMMDTAEGVDPNRVRELLDQGIFLL